MSQRLECYLGPWDGEEIIVDDWCREIRFPLPTHCWASPSPAGESEPLHIESRIGVGSQAPVGCAGDQLT
jgi:hypothetical protein